ncbi:MAG: ATP-binding protein [Candidatus Cloacimonetes bacterium]|nr:ATP-binding protein [Candidatus Cloacimonadota bacterium]
MSKTPNTNAADLLCQLYFLQNPQSSKEQIVNDDPFASRPEVRMNKGKDPLAVLDDFVAKKDTAKTRSIIRKLLSDKALSIYELSASDIDIISPLWIYFQSKGRASWDFNDIIQPIKNSRQSIIHQIKTVISLLDRKILRWDDRIRSDYHLNYEFVLNSSFAFDSSFVNALLGSNILDIARCHFIDNHADCKDALRPFLMLIKTIFDSYPELTNDCAEIPGNFYGKILQLNYRVMCKALNDLPDSTTLSVIKKDYDLTVEEMLILIIVYYHNNTAGESINMIKLLNLFTTNNVEASELEVCVTGQNSLFAKHLLQYERGMFGSSTDLCLSDEIMRNLNEQPTETIFDDTKLATILKTDKRFVLLNTKQTMEQLIIPEATKELLNMTVQKLKHPELYDLSQWGLLPDSLSCDVNNGMNILLYGPSGTGKTFAAGALANSLGKQLVSINAPTLKSHFYGDSQQIVKDAFQLMRNIAQKHPNPPVFLLNECDQLIHSRTTLRASCDETENAIQNIILEELETFPSIFIATTNLLENIDTAFYRRFAYKILLPLPDYECRRQLWKLHLPDTIPGAKYIDIDFLAEHYTLTGGQIKLIVANACNSAITRQIANKHISQIDIEKFIVNETMDYADEDTRKIGFRIS